MQMDDALNEVALRWRLTAREREQLASASKAVAANEAAVDQCLDIDRALLWLLGDRETTRRWLRTPHAAFYHVEPLFLLMSSGAGRRMVRAALLNEAAAAREIVAAAMPLQK